MMIRLNLLLLVALMASALYLVRVQYDSRRLYAEIERAQNEFRKLEVEHERLQVEKRAQATRRASSTRFRRSIGRSTEKAPCGRLGSCDRLASCS